MALLASLGLVSFRSPGTEYFTLSHERERPALQAPTTASPLVLTVNEEFETLDLTRWHLESHTFACNESRFLPDHAQVQDDILSLLLAPRTLADRLYGGADLRFKATSLPVNQAVGIPAKRRGPDDVFHYGRFEVRMKGSKVRGAVSSFFIFRLDPWQEIDIELLGSEPRKVLTNVFFNPGPEGAANNQMRHDPLAVDVEFDTQADFHTYAFEWSETEIRWFVDGQLIRRRSAPSSSPAFPMALRLNHWLTCKDAEDWAGAFDKATLPGEALYDNIRIWQRK